MGSKKQRKLCIVNGDDFGASKGINRGIVEAHTNGILTSASLMVNMPAVAEAAELSASNPALSIGLHVNFTNEGDPVIDLADADAARDELHRQFRSFVELLGRAPSHLDSHHNVHRNPVLEPLFLELADQHDLFLRDHSPVRLFASFYGQWDGVSHPEHISPQQLAGMLGSEVGEGVTEVACHPGYMTPDFQSEYGIEREVELRSICDPDVRQAVDALDIELVNYYEAREEISRWRG